MSLETQMMTLLFSYLFGFFYMLSYDFGKKYLYHKYLFVRFLSNFVFTFGMALLYYFILLKVNYGTLHFYELIAILLGFISAFGLFTKVRK